APNAIAWRWLFRSRSIPRVIVHSQSVADIVCRYGQQKHRIHLVALGVAPTEIAARASPRLDSPEPVRIVTVGGITHTKGHHDALVALADVRRKIAALEYTIIGEGRDESYMRYLQRLIKRLDLENAVRFLLDATELEKNEALRRADIYIQP